MLMDHSTSARFKSWLDKLIELFFEQINLVIVFVVAAAIVKPFQDRSLGDTFVLSTLAIITLLMALMGPSMIGLAAGAGSMGYLQSMMTVGALRRAGRALGGAVRARADDRATSARTASSQTPSASRTAGDPTQSAAARRQAAPRPAFGAFRRSDVGDSLSDRRAAARYQAAGRTPRGGDGRAAGDTRREQALVRATMMRRRADALRAQGDPLGAGVLARKAQLHRRFGQGGDITRPSRFTAAERNMRRLTYGQALAEVSGMHGLERDELAQRMSDDAARLPILQRDLALAGATGGGTDPLHREHAELSARLTASRARLAALTPEPGEQLPRATRQAAAALANERLPQELRSAPYAVRHGAARESAFVRRIADAGTQDARDELARARATGARIAALPADQRPPIAPPRRRSTAGRLRREQAVRRAGDGAADTPVPQTSDGTEDPPSRSPSSTMAHLRRLRDRRGEE